VEEGSSSDVAPHRAAFPGEGRQETTLGSVCVNFKDKAVGRIEAAVDRHQHLHRLEVNRQPDHVAYLPFTRVLGSTADPTAVP